MSATHSSTGPCPYCTTGCAECDGTGQRTVTIVELDGGAVMRAHSSGTPDATTLDALEAIGRAAADYLKDRWAQQDAAEAEGS